MNRYVIDSYAWIEYVEGSEKGRIIESILLDESNEIYSHILTISEVVSRIKRKGMDAEIAFGAISSLSIIIHIDTDTAKSAGFLHAELRKTIKDFGLTDAFILDAARKMNAKILTGDPHFKNFKEAVIV